MKRAARHGGKLILVDPRATDIARLSYLHLRPRPGTDRDAILDAVWGMKYGGTTRTLDGVDGAARADAVAAGHHVLLSHGLALEVIRRRARTGEVESAYEAIGQRRLGDYD